MLRCGVEISVLESVVDTVGGLFLFLGAFGLWYGLYEDLPGESFEVFHLPLAELFNRLLNFAFIWVRLLLVIVLPVLVSRLPGFFLSFFVLLAVVLTLAVFAIVRCDEEAVLLLHLGRLRAVRLSLLRCGRLRSRYFGGRFTCLVLFLYHLGNRFIFEDVSIVLDGEWLAFKHGSSIAPGRFDRRGSVMCIAWPVLIDLDKSSTVAIVDHILEGAAASGSSAADGVRPNPGAPGGCACRPTKVGRGLEVFVDQLTALLVEHQL